jgi:hypothetical protein
MPRGLYEIDRILEGPDDKDRFLIKWVGYADADNTWEPRCHLPQNVLEEYLGVPAEGRNEEQDESDNSSVENLSVRRRVGKRARREPGVNVAQEVDAASTQGKEPANPPRLAKGMGIYAVVHVCGRFLHPTTALREADPNNWRVKVYQMVVTGWGREVLKKERAYVLLLEPGTRHDEENLGEKFFCRFAHAKLVEACPPNQAFKPSDFTTTSQIVQEGSDSSSSSDDETSDECAEDDDGTNADNVVWETDPEGGLRFRPTMPTCYRQVAEPASTKHPPSLPHDAEPSVHEAEWFADLFFPQLWWRNEVMPAWNARLENLGFKRTTVGEANVWRGLWRLMSLNPQYARKDFWDTVKQRIPYQWDPPPFREHMTRDRFNQLTSCFKLRNDAPPHFRDRFFEVRRMQEAFNEHMKLIFSPSWAVCLDESMSKWLNEYAPGWMAVGRKPRPFGNEYHTMACAMTHILFWMEMVEGKDRPPQLGPLQHVEAHGKLCGLVLRAAEGIKGSNRVIGMDSGFGVLAALPELRKRGLHGTIVMKKKKYWPKGLPGDQILEALRMQEIGTTQVLVGKFKGEKIWVGCQVDSKHTTLIANTWSTTERTGSKKKRKVGGRLVEFNYCEYQGTWYWIRHAVDDSNHNRSHPLPLEDTMKTKEWVMRQFTFVDAVAECNAREAYNYWVRKPQNRPLVTNVEFRNIIAQHLVFNKEWQREETNRAAKGNHVDPSSPAQPACQLRHYAPGVGEWDNSRKEYKAPAQPYQKYYCKFTKKCKNKVRTYCNCTPRLTICIQCFPNHVIEQKSMLNI